MSFYTVKNNPGAPGYSALRTYAPDVYSMLSEDFARCDQADRTFGTGEGAIPARDINLDTGLHIGRLVTHDDTVFVSEPRISGLSPRQIMCGKEGEFALGRRLWAPNGGTRDNNHHAVVLLECDPPNGRDLPKNCSVHVEVEQTALDGLYVFTMPRLPHNNLFEPLDYIYKQTT
ncbi:MAG TPA: hypothetical protein VJ836_07460 [Candidatus Saccharimonadales bacterium]|nr:hypothetical protein [Candidatus Saccharimonadales bacterium]